MRGLGIAVSEFRFVTMWDALNRSGLRLFTTHDIEVAVDVMGPFTYLLLGTFMFRFE